MNRYKNRIQASMYIGRGKLYSSYRYLKSPKGVIVDAMSYFFSTIRGEKMYGGAYGCDDSIDSGDFVGINKKYSTAFNEIEDKIINDFIEVSNSDSGSSSSSGDYNNYIKADINTCRALMLDSELDRVNPCFIKSFLEFK